MPVGILDRDAVERVLVRVGVLRGELIELGRHQIHARELRVDLAGNEVLAGEGPQELVQRLALPRHQLQNQERRDEAVVGVEIVAEVIVSGDFAAEDRVGLAHPPLEEGVADAVHVRRAAVFRHDVPDRIAGAQVVDDRRARILDEKGFGQERRDEIAGDEPAGAVDEEAAIGVAVPRDADIRLLRDHRLDDVAPVFLDQRVRLVVRKPPVDLEAELRRAAGELFEQFRRDEPGHPAAGVEDDVEWP